MIKILITGGSVFDVTNKSTRITHMNNGINSLLCVETVMMYFNVVDADSHDCEILQSVLEDGNYDISSEDCVSLQLCISYFCPN